MTPVRLKRHKFIHAPGKGESGGGGGVREKDRHTRSEVRGEEKSGKRNRETHTQSEGRRKER